MLRALAALWIVVACATAGGEESAPPSEAAERTAGQTAQRPTTEAIRGYINDLGSRSYWVRRRAAERLLQAGRDAEPFLEEVRNHRNLEVARTARTILEQFRWGIYPDTPPRVVELIMRYRLGNDRDKAAALQSLFEQGPSGWRTLSALLAAERLSDAPDALAALEIRVNTAVHDRILADQWDEAQKLLELVAATGRDSAQRNLAAFLALRGKLEPAVARLSGNEPLSSKRLRQLAWLHRAAGNLAAARQVAARIDDAALHEGLAFEAGDWNALIELARNEGDPGQNLERLGHLMAYHHRAGQETKLSETLAQLKEIVAQTEDSGQIWNAVEILLVVERPEDAFSALRRGSGHLAAFDLLVKQLRYDEALQVAAQAPADTPAQRAQIQTREAQVRWLLGQHDQARRMLRQLADAELAGEAAASIPSVLETEMKIGLRDDAFQHAAAALAKQNFVSQPKPILAQLFPEQTAEAEAWWRVITATQPNADPRQSLAQLDRLLAQPQQQPDLSQWAARAQQTADHIPYAQRADLLVAIADTLARGKRYDLAAAGLESVSDLAGGGSAALLRRGDLAAEQQQWKDAAAWYRRAFDADRSQVLPLYLHGHALTQAGDTQQGQRAMRQAELLPLADERARHELAEGLAKRGLTAAADAQHQLLLATSRFRLWELGFALRRLGNRALAAGRFAQAADYFERSMFDVLRLNTAFVQREAYLTVPFVVRECRLRAALHESRWEDAAAHAQGGLEILPNDIGLALRLVPAFDQAGRSAPADRFFEEVFQRQQTLCERYPQLAERHNQLAWLAARCNRRLDDALRHAQQAVALAPNRAAYLDTLAEVHFQRGARREAIDLILRCLELAPDNAFFQSQLARFTMPAELPIPPPEED